MKIEIEVGDRITYKGGFRNTFVLMITETNDIYSLKGFEILKIERIGSNGWYTVYEKEEKKELLTGEERTFLKPIIKHITKKISFIKKYCGIVYLVKEDGFFVGDINISNFDIQFKGLKEDKEYALSELGLED